MATREKEAGEKKPENREFVCQQTFGMPAIE